jgi:hypothetical protein
MADDEETKRRRAERLREAIERAGDDDAPRTPREFAERAAREAREAEQRDDAGDPGDEE